VQGKFKTDTPGNLHPATRCISIKYLRVLLFNYKT
jgi:hypothetical protein